jgi:hypothetical protein
MAPKIKILNTTKVNRHLLDKDQLICSYKNSRAAIYQSFPPFMAPKDMVVDTVTVIQFADMADMKHGLGLLIGEAE